MQAAAASDAACAPNVITYSALMTACCAGGRPDKAYEVFQVCTPHKAACCSVRPLMRIITGCLKRHEHPVQARFACACPSDRHGVSGVTH